MTQIDTRPAAAIGADNIAQHTPGQWSVDPYLWTVFARTPDWTPVAFTYGDDAEGRVDDRMVANAYLIAAAPEMLEALRELVIAGHSLTPSSLVWRKVHAVIAKATGEASK